MRNWFERMKWKISAWMQGRHGADKLSRHLIWLALIFWIVSLFFMKTYWRILPLVFYWGCLFWSLFRILSRNHAARNAELALYEKILAKPVGFFRLLRNMWRDRKTHRYFRCSCGAVLRVPKGKGEILIRCPKCGKQIDRNT